MNYPITIKPNKNKRKFFGRVVVFQIALVIALVLTQIAIQFSQTHHWVGFARNDDTKTFYGLYGEAKADYLDCNQQLEEMKKARDEANADIMGDIK